MVASIFQLIVAVNRIAHNILNVSDAVLMSSSLAKNNALCTIGVAYEILKIHILGNILHRNQTCLTYNFEILNDNNGVFIVRGFKEVLG